MTIIGLSGTNGSGKDTVAAILGDAHDFFVASATDMLEKELVKRGLPTDRLHKRTLSAEWRRQFGTGVIIDKAVESAKKAGKDKLIIGSLRNPGEADRVHELAGQVLWVDAEPKIRYERINAGQRGRVEDDKTFEQFLSEEQQEMQHSGDETTLSMSAVKERADVFIENNGNSLEAFQKQILESLKIK